MSEATDPVIVSETFTLDEERLKQIRYLFEELYSSKDEIQATSRAHGGDGCPELESFDLFCGTMLYRAVAEYIEYAKMMHDAADDTDGDTDVLIDIIKQTGEEDAGPGQD